MNKPERIVTSEVLYDVKDHIATITLNGPERMNTISGPMLGALAQAPAGRRRRPRRAVVILTGPGRAFCAGLDLRGPTRAQGRQIGGGAARRLDRLDLRNTPPTVLHAMDKPSICA